jgi:hypothetical protein
MRGGGVNDGRIVRRGSLPALCRTFNGLGQKHGQVGNDRVVGRPPPSLTEATRHLLFAVRKSSRWGAFTPTGMVRSSPWRSVSSIPTMHQLPTPVEMGTETTRIGLLPFPESAMGMEGEGARSR